MDKKDIKCKFSYKCGICGSEYNNVLDRAQCEITCAKKLEAEAKAAEETKKREEQKMRKDAIDEGIKRLHKMLTDYVNDYGHYEYGDGGENTNFYWPSRLWHNFWM